MTSGEKTVIRLPGFLVLNNQKNYADPTRADVLSAPMGTDRPNPTPLNSFSKQQTLLLWLMARKPWPVHRGC